MQRNSLVIGILAVMLVASLAAFALFGAGAQAAGGGEDTAISGEMPVLGLEGVQEMIVEDE